MNKDRHKKVHIYKKGKKEIFFLNREIQLYSFFQFIYMTTFFLIQGKNSHFFQYIDIFLYIKNFSNI